MVSARLSQEGGVTMGFISNLKKKKIAQESSQKFHWGISDFSFNTQQFCSVSFLLGWGNKSGCSCGKQTFYLKMRKYKSSSFSKVLSSHQI